MISKLLSASVFLILSSACVGHAALGQGVQGTKGKDVPEAIEVRLAVKKKKFRVGELIPIQITITNRGEIDLFVGRHIVGYTVWTYTLHLYVQDEKNRYSRKLVAGPPLVSPREKDTFWDALYRDWILLPPGYSFGTTREYDHTVFEFLGKPGRYLITGVYTSRGMDAPFYYNRLADEPEKIAALPYKVWKGTVETNSIQIEVELDRPGKRSRK